MKKLLVILAIVFAGFFMFGCKKADSPTDETKNVSNEEVKTDDKKETEEKKNEETSDIDFNGVTSVKLPMSDVAYETVDVDGKKYVDLAEFGKYMELSKNRYTYKIDTEKKAIRFKLEIVSKDKWSDPVDATGLQPEKYTLKVKNEKVEDADVILKDNKNALVDLMSMAHLLKFSYKDGEMIFEDADNLKPEVSQNRDYEWYMDQGHTGKYSDGNCGPTSLAMILKWLDPNSAATGESLRDEIPNNGDWWTTNIFESYFESNKMSIDDTLYKSPETIIDMINNGDIVLVCLKMGEISPNKQPNSSNIGRFYGFDGGHFLLIKGYKIVDGKLYYEVYDPNNWDMKYDNGEPMGKDRLYAATEMDKAITTWWSGIYGIKPLGK